MNLCAVDCLSLATSARLGNLLEVWLLKPHRPLNSTKLMQFSGDCFTLNLEKQYSGEKSGTVETYLVPVAIKNSFTALEIGHSVV